MRNNSLQPAKATPAERSVTHVARSVHFPECWIQSMGRHMNRMKLANTKWWSSLLGIVAFAAFAAGCETVEGIGEDVEELGDEIQDEANDARR
jgi:predicted small secreted protein